MSDKSIRALRKLAAPLRVAPGTKVALPRGFDPTDHADLSKKSAADVLTDGVEALAEFQTKLAAQAVDAVLVVLQGIDASGKDSTIKHVMSGLNPQGVSVTSFKVPGPEELDHDYLWRYARALPRRGVIGIFNRSHYEEVLVVRVHPEVLERERLPREDHASSGKLWGRRFRQINEWERYLVENGVHVVKLFLNLSRQEQRRRFLERIDHPEKSWKFSAADVAERKYWNDYQRAFSAMLTHTSTEWAPWHVIPADHEWFARLAAAA
ncbi:MAG TPA: PPK2 family polyphosphate kinase, partial [Candidatus Limnocylindria bacterium]|nr:PPK2 family polyphosphate kinase [Candidatus Limnocylindria bacterium]